MNTNELEVRYTRDTICHCCGTTDDDGARMRSYGVLAPTGFGYSDTYWSSAVCSIKCYNELYEKES